MDITILVSEKEAEYLHLSLEKRIEKITKRIEELKMERSAVNALILHIESRVELKKKGE